MQNRNWIRLIATLAGALLLTVLFVSYRARSFRYCAGTGDHPAARVVDSAGSCGADEEPLEIRSVGWLGRLKLAAQTTARAFGAN